MSRDRPNELEECASTLPTGLQAPLGHGKHCDRWICGSIAPGLAGWIDCRGGTSRVRLLRTRRVESGPAGRLGLSGMQLVHSICWDASNGVLTQWLKH